jgi:hypothetical protein
MVTPYTTYLIPPDANKMGLTSIMESSPCSLFIWITVPSADTMVLRIACYRHPEHLETILS